MTSEVMGGQRASQMVPSFMQLTASRLSGGHQGSARGFIGGKKAFDAHFLQGDILRRSEGRNRT